jgi:hypothetical protein
MRRKKPRLSSPAILMRVSNQYQHERSSCNQLNHAHTNVLPLKYIPRRPTRAIPMDIAKGLNHSARRVGRLGDLPWIDPSAHYNRERVGIGTKLKPCGDNTLRQWPFFAGAAALARRCCCCHSAACCVDRIHCSSARISRTNRRANASCRSGDICRRRSIASSSAGVITSL